MSNVNWIKFLIPNHLKLNNCIIYYCGNSEFVSRPSLTELNSIFDRTEPEPESEPESEPEFEPEPNPYRIQFSSGSVPVRVRFAFGLVSDSVE